VPADDGTDPRVCSRCDKWFAAASRQRVCTGCLTPSERARRALGTSIAERIIAPETLQVKPMIKSLSEAMCKRMESGGRVTTLEADYVRQLNAGRRHAKPAKLEICADLALTKAKQIDARPKLAEWLARERDRSIQDGLQDK
jgi:hypothetical protein